MPNGHLTTIPDGAKRLNATIPTVPPMPGGVEMVRHGP
jgi:hypothetical protein